MKQIEYFRFEVLPDSPYMAYAGEMSFAYGYPIYRIEVGYGGRRYGLNRAMPPGDIGVTESYLEHFIRDAVREFQKAIRSDEIDKAGKALDVAKDKLVKAADEYAKQARK